MWSCLGSVEVVKKVRAPDAVNGAKRRLCVTREACFKRPIVSYRKVKITAGHGQVLMPSDRGP